MIMNEEKMFANVRKMADKAKDGTLKIDNQIYTFTYSRYHSHYVVKNGEDEVLLINMKNLSAAKRFFKWYLEN